MSDRIDSRFELYRQSDLFKSFDEFVTSLPESLSFKEASFTLCCLVNQNTLDILTVDNDDENIVFMLGVLLGRSECYSAFSSILERMRNHNASDVGKGDSSI